MPFILNRLVQTGNDTIAVPLLGRVILLNIKMIDAPSRFKCQAFYLEAYFGTPCLMYENYLDNVRQWYLPRDRTKKQGCNCSLLPVLKIAFNGDKQTYIFFKLCVLFNCFQIVKSLLTMGIFKTIAHPIK